jgi:hypothetical protein
MLEHQDPNDQALGLVHTPFPQSLEHEHTNSRSPSPLDDVPSEDPEFGRPRGGGIDLTQPHHRREPAELEARARFQQVGHLYRIGGVMVKRLWSRCIYTPWPRPGECALGLRPAV